MKTHTWQTKALTLFIAALAVLWLATACTEDSGIRIITPAAPCGPDIPLTPSIEYITLEGARVPEGWERYLEAAKNPLLISVEDPVDRERFILSMRMTARAERLRPETDRIRAILDKYDNLISKHDFFTGGYAGSGWVRAISTEEGLLTDKQVIVIRVNIHPRKLPPEERIPECLDGIPVHFEYHPDVGKPLKESPNE